MSQLLLYILGYYAVFQGLSLLVLFPLSTITDHYYYDKIKNEGYIREEENLTLKEEIKENIKFNLSLFFKPGMPFLFDLLLIFGPNYVLKAMKEEELKIGIIKKIENESTNIKEANKSLEENISITKDDIRENTGLTEEQKAWFDRKFNDWFENEFKSGRVFEKIISSKEADSEENDTGYSYSKKRNPNKKSKY